jgi:hypothetical protein
MTTACPHPSRLVLISPRRIPARRQREVLAAPAPASPGWAALAAPQRCQRSLTHSSGVPGIWTARWAQIPRRNGCHTIPESSNVVFQGTILSNRLVIRREMIRLLVRWRVCWFLRPAGVFPLQHNCEPPEQGSERRTPRTTLILLITLLGDSDACRPRPRLDPPPSGTAHPRPVPLQPSLREEADDDPFRRRATQQMVGVRISRY